MLLTSRVFCAFPAEGLAELGWLLGLFYGAPPPPFYTQKIKQGRGSSARLFLSFPQSKSFVSAEFAGRLGGFPMR